MNKILNYILIVFLFTLLSCDYKPILSKKNYQFSINVEEINGDQQVNSILLDNFDNLSNDNNNEYYITVTSIKEKNIILKDSKGDPSIYELIVDVSYEVKKEGKTIIENNLTRNTTYNNISDKFELENYENNIIKNLCTNISDRIIFSISEINE